MTIPATSARDANVPALRLNSLQAGYDRQLVISDINLEIFLGEWFALLGPNGSGKTTLLYCAVGMLTPMAGDISVCGYSLKDDPAGAKGSLGYACAPERLPGLLTGRQCLEIYAAAKKLSEIDSDVLTLAEAMGFTSMLDRFVDTYSTGARQKLAVLLALLGNPKLIALDEAFNGLDPASALALKIHLRERVFSRRSSVLLATHALDVVERYATRAALLLAGKLIHQWTADEIAMARNSVQGLEPAIAAAAGLKDGD